jgi:hypothetical protein
LSYTQRLEDRIKELEDQVASLAKTPPSVAGSSHSSPPLSVAQEVSSQASRQAVDEQGMTRSFRSLKIDDKGSITYHGATSFFNLPSDRTGPSSSDVSLLNPSSPDTDSQRRERLIHNAWHQRAMENLSEIPVGFMFSVNKAALDGKQRHAKSQLLTCIPGAVSISPQHPLVLDTTAFQFYIQTCFYSYV